MNNINDEIPRYKKKSKTASKSSSNKRSDHKHQYEKIIIYKLGVYWGKRCKVCGRIDTTINKEGLLKDAESDRFRFKEALTVQEMREKFPGVKLYKINTETWEYELIEDGFE